MFSPWCPLLLSSLSWLIVLLSVPSSPPLAAGTRRSNMRGLCRSSFISGMSVLSLRAGSTCAERIRRQSPPLGLCEMCLCCFCVMIVLYFLCFVLGGRWWSSCPRQTNSRLPNILLLKRHAVFDSIEKIEPQCMTEKQLSAATWPDAGHSPTWPRRSAGTAVPTWREREREVARGDASGSRDSGIPVSKGRAGKRAKPGLVSTRWIAFHSDAPPELRMCFTVTHTMCQQSHRGQQTVILGTFFGLSK